MIRQTRKLYNKAVNRIVIFMFINLLFCGLIFGSDKQNKFQNPGLLSINGYVHTQWFYDLHKGVYPKYSFLLRRGRIEFRYELADIIASEIEIGCDKLALTVKDAYIEYKINRSCPDIRGNS